MRILVGLENNNEGYRSLAWALELPGCFAYGSDRTEALANMPRAVVNYARWLEAHTDAPWFTAESFDIHMEEAFTDIMIDENFDLAPGGYEVNAWFRHDWKPLTGQDVERGLALLGWTRTDLLDIVDGLPADLLDRTYPGERWSVRGILQHIANADLWYLDRLGLAPWTRADLPQEFHERLRLTRTRLEEVLPTLVGVHQVLGAQGEFWSPRKLLRRSLWHERDHTGHILKLLTEG